MTYEKDAYYITITSTAGKDIRNLLSSQNIEYEVTPYPDEMPEEVPNHIFFFGRIETEHILMFKSKTNIIPIIEQRMKEKHSGFQCGYAYKGFKYSRPPLPKEDMERINRTIAEAKARKQATGSYW